jgi:hypothetical protein
MDGREPVMIDWKGKEILYLDFRNLKGKDIDNFIVNCKKYISKLPEQSTLYLSNVEGMEYTFSSIRTFKSFSKYNESFLKASAIVGINKQMQMLYNVSLSLAHRDNSRVRTFNTEVEAKEWLINAVF